VKITHSRQLRLGFDAFRDNPQPPVTGKRDDGREERVGRWAVIPYKTLIDLEFRSAKFEHLVDRRPRRHPQWPPSR
jgi:hypothetical protein